MLIKGYPRQESRMTINNNNKDMIVLSYALTYARKRVKLDKEQLCKHLRTKIGRTKSWKQGVIVMHSTSEKWQNHP